MLSNKPKELPGNLPIVLDNETCAYCSVRLLPSSKSNTEDHVISIRFVPKGKLDDCFNLIVRACECCNREKSGLEDDISAISMQGDVWNRPAVADDILVKDAKRKAKGSVSRRMHKPVKDSAEKIVIKAPVAPGVEFSFNFIGPAQIDDTRIAKLALMHVRAFFYWATYNIETKRGRFWSAPFTLHSYAIRSNWGNPTHKAFMNTVINWKLNVLVITADGFFKVVIRQHPTLDFWSWALEWNHNYRIIGFIGAREEVESITTSFPKSEIISIPLDRPNSRFDFSIDVALEEESDILFAWED